MDDATYKIRVKLLHLLTPKSDKSSIFFKVLNYKEELEGNQEPSDVITQIVNKSQRPLLSSAGTKAANAERGRPG